ncbi:MAG: HD domain-containing protein [Candidatus Thorarchaeota archaeon]|jgi:(p)ppGpp synthase/HD superfamily hydrolase
MTPRELNDWEIGRLSEALLLAISAHDGSYRGDGIPYVIHPIRIALHAASLGLSTQTIMAAILHDVVEDTDTPLEEIYSQFGDEVGDMVTALTKPERGTPDRSHIYKEQLLEGPVEARMVKLLDIQDNLADIEEFLEPVKAEAYRKSREALADVLRNSLDS